MDQTISPPSRRAVLDEECAKVADAPQPAPEPAPTTVPVAVVGAASAPPATARAVPTAAPVAGTLPPSAARPPLATLAEAPITAPIVIRPAASAARPAPAPAQAPPAAPTASPPVPSPPRATPVRSAARPPVAIPAPPTAMARPKPRPRRSPGRALLSFFTIAAVFAITLVTTIPAVSLLTPADVAAASAPSFRVMTAVEPQELGVISGGADIPVARDEYTVTALREKLKALTAGRAAQFYNDPTWAIQWPIAVGVPMTDQFGPRVLCDTCGVTMHRGVDFLPGRGAPIQAITAGVVRYVEESDSGLGVHVIIDHQIGGRLVSSVYCHLEFGSVAMAVGEQVHVGQLVGTTGDTGFAFGPHLHFEIREGGTQNVDPVAWLQTHAG